MRRTEPIRVLSSLLFVGMLSLGLGASAAELREPEMQPLPLASNEAANRALVEEAFSKWGSGTGGPYDLLDDSVVWTIVGKSDASRAYPSRDAFMSEVIQPFNARMSRGLKPTIRQITTDGDKVVIFFDARGVAKDGVPYENTYAWFWEMQNGRVVRSYAFYDSVTFNDLWRRVSP